MWFNKKKETNEALIKKEAEEFALNFSGNQQVPLETKLREELGSLNSSNNSGVVVNNFTALNNVAVYACIKAIAETLASLPFPVYRRLTRGKDRFQEHPLWQILNVSPVPDQSMGSMNWMEAGIAHLLSWGNWYNEKVTLRNGDLEACYLLPPNKVTPEFTKSGKLQYKVSGSITPIPAENMFVVNGLGFDGVQGYSPIRLARNSIGLAMATERFGAAWFGNGSRGQAVLKHPEQLSEKAQANLRKQIENIHQGPDNAHRLMILEEGMTLEQIGVPPEDAQFLGTRLFQLQEICRLFRISPVVVQELSRSTFSNNEQEMISFVVQTIRPWARRIENAVLRQLIPRSEQREIFAEFLLDGLLRGDTISRYQAYAIARQWGWQTANDILELENQNPTPGPEGDQYILPSNFVNAKALLEVPKPEPEPQPKALEAPLERSEEEDGQIDQEQPQKAPEVPPEAVKASLDCVRDNLNRMLRREIEAVRKAAQKPSEFLDWLDNFYSKEKPLIQRAMLPSLNTFAALIVSGDSSEKLDQLQLVQSVTSGIAESGHHGLLELSGQCSVNDFPDAIERWASSRIDVAEEIISKLNTYQHDTTH